MQFNQKTFYENLLAILRADYAKEIKNATAKELYNAVSKAIMSHLYDDWKKSEVKRKKRCGYLSAEFLVGRAIYSNLLNLGVLEEVKEALAKEGVDINTFEEIEDAPPFPSAASSISIPSKKSKMLRSGTAVWEDWQRAIWKAPHRTTFRLMDTACVIATACSNKAS